jgi:hypothetical protein
MSVVVVVFDNDRWSVAACYSGATTFPCHFRKMTRSQCVGLSAPLVRIPITCAYFVRYDFDQGRTISNTVLLEKVKPRRFPTVSRYYCLFVAAMSALIFMCAMPSMAQRPPKMKGDPREAVALDPAEAEALLTGMRTYLETIQGIVTALAENQLAHIANIAPMSGAKLMQNVSPLTAMKAPIGFTSLSLDTHDKFDRLAEKAKRGSSRSEILTDLSALLGNCRSCHEAYRLSPYGGPR